MSAHDQVPPRLHELEALVMEEVWRQGPATVRSVMEALNDTKKSRAYTTFMTIMARLHRKGLLDRRREGKTDIYLPRISREDYLQVRAQNEVAELVQQYGDVALVQFAKEMASLDRKRQDRLRRLARGA
jgi:predicted transcriptional regulator